MRRSLQIILLFILYLAFLADVFAAPQPIASAADLSAAINNSAAGAVIKIAEGYFKMDKPITVFNEGARLIGAGSDKTVLDFAAAKQGGQAILIRGPSISIEGLTILNAPGDGVVARGVRDVSIRDVTVRWQDAAKAGGYGIYPVQCKGVLVHASEVTGANEAGIYVGQSQGARVTGNTVYGNVVGIDIENSSAVVVENNHSYENSIGIAVTGRPYLIVKNPAYIKIADNTIERNDKDNLGPSGAFTTDLGHGVGLMVIATKKVTIRGNRFVHGEKSDAATADIVLANFNWLNRGYKGDATFDRKFGEISIGANYAFDAKMAADGSQLADADFPSKDRAIHVVLEGMGNEKLTSSHICFSAPLAVTMNAGSDTSDLKLLNCEDR